MIKLNKNEEKIILIVIVAVALIFAAYKFIVPKPDNVKVISKAAKAEESGKAKDNSEPSRIYVYVTGEVNKPGVYLLKPGDRVVDAVTMAGGFTADADYMSVNLAEKLKDEKLITIAKKSAVDNNSNNAVKSVVLNGKIDINTASAKQIDEFLPGIGETLAGNIVSYRNKNGRFKSIDEVSRVDGIGSGKRFEKIKEMIYIN